MRSTPTRNPRVDVVAPCDRLPPLRALESHAILKACIEARVALAELQMATRMIPNEGILINTLSVLEAGASSEIDDIVTSTDRLFRYAGHSRRSTDPTTLQGLLCSSALVRGFESVKERPMTATTAFEVWRTLNVFGFETGTASDPAAKDQPGATASGSKGGTHLHNRLAKWQRSLNDETGADPLIRMAIGYSLFEAIHPFSKGTGRTGRILSQLYLVEQRLLALPVLYLSRAFISNRDDYGRQLNNVVTHGVWEPWILYLVNAVNDAARWTTAKVLAMGSLLLETRRHVQQHAPSLYSRELVELIFFAPYCRIADVVNAGVAKRQTASEYLKRLSLIGVLDEIKVGREKLFKHSQLMTLLTSEQHSVPSYPS